MEDFGAKEQAQASSSKPKKRGREPNPIQDVKSEKKRESNRKYQEKKAAEKKKKEKMYEELKKENEEMKKKMDEQQLEINMLKEPLSEINAEGDKLAREVNDEAVNFLNKDDKENDAGNSLLNMPLDLDYLNSLGLEDFRLEGLEDINELLDSYSNKTKGNEYIDNMTSPRAPFGTAIDIPSSSMNERAERSKDDKSGKLIREGFEMIARGLAARNATFKKINTHVTPMPENKIWNLLENIGIDSQLITNAYIYFINNPEKVRAVLGCPREKRKELVEKLVFGSSGH